MQGRKKWSRPQAIIFSNNPGTLVSDSTTNYYIPTGDEFVDFIILSDHNRQSVSISKQRIESRQRMINGTMRSYHTADKINLTTSWNRLPSRAFSEMPQFVNGEPVQDLVLETGPKPNYIGLDPTEYTADGGAGGATLLEWYEDHPGPFYVFLSYDKFGEGNMNRYTQVLRMYFGGFDFEIEKRGKDLHDMWNITMSLEEV